MPLVAPKGRMKKELSLLAVYSLATGTTLSAGFFLLPGIAAANAGPAMVLAYILAAIPMIPAIMSMLELATAMPRAGGAYYFIDRSLGPLMGTIGGIGTWLALVLKTAFALVGMGAYITLLIPESWSFESTRGVAVGLAVLFTLVNMLGAKQSGRFQIVLVALLLFILAGFTVTGLPQIDYSNFGGFFSEGADSIIATAGLVYISYVGATKVASVSEEVRDPERNLPLGVFLSFGTAVFVYAVGTFVMVGVLGAGGLASDEHISTPVASVAEVLGGSFGKWVVTIAALLAFSSVANAGIMSASRYPLAMARDHLVSARLRKLNAAGVPILSIWITLLVVILFVMLPLEGIVKLASATQLLIFAVINLGVIVMRESKIEAYDPGYRAPWYPWTQIAGIVLPMWLIAEMGWLSIVSMTVLVGFGAGWFYVYASTRVERHGAVFHVFERLGRRRFVGLDRELRTILREKGLRPDDPFDELVIHADVIDAEPNSTFESLVLHVSQRLSPRVHHSVDSLARHFLDGTRVGATPVSGGVALPHVRLHHVDEPHLAMVRSRNPIEILLDDGEPESKERPPERVSAMFFLVSPEADPGRHLRTLAQIAERVDDAEFLPEWINARSPRELRHLLLRKERFLSIRIKLGAPTESYIGQHIRDIELPDGCLIVLINRGDEIIIPQGRSLLAEHDVLSVIGDPAGVAALRKRLSLDAPDEDGDESHSQSIDASESD